MKVKICGITTQQAADQAIESGADFIGFVFAKSKRRIDKDRAKAIAESIPSNVKKVGVFVNEDVEVIKDIAETVGLDYVQLHGDESPEFCDRVGFPIIKAFQVRSKSDLEEISNYNCNYYLLDSPAGKYRGGNGETFDWKLTKDLNLDGKVILAGGLHAENVQDAIKEVQPEGIDVSSGVETDGAKDLNKIDAFIKEAKKGDTDGNLSATE
ncbi:phosphoribosylanthranilate isomerase [Aquibacillus koreensis]|uniref:N-(5'-phosphoribosyl)anthranilate isomerase n=1 Tax=Aquibacillus koreensis TaxID=279446 RepID=A0A9X3WIY1_9BACI|nr:phosphoribosylanthranilate isomerase [Aquibacillus koreensis]MCT2538189.1 phosphoribosylanthranilate isomerase [Aquibacillus koreensis]MDC3420867.1 phosphoribosylanthranilate isomerase [Aquibacillus koreensis]